MPFSESPTCWAKTSLDPTNISATQHPTLHQRQVRRRRSNCSDGLLEERIALLSLRFDRRLVGQVRIRSESRQKQKKASLGTKTRVHSSPVRASAEPLPKVETPEVSIDLERRIVDVCGQRVRLTPKDFDVLRTLTIQQGKPLTHKWSLHTVWGRTAARKRRTFAW